MREFGLVDSGFLCRIGGGGRFSVCAPKVVWRYNLVKLISGEGYCKTEKLCREQMG